eukprot:CAMPEP_0196725546 /NCGR_PEP_ID=MMETSP1091-20130531/7076_1 /TAXON_ID=302021 /ORGANISM="Rhodomonas sp., Strain CCMP768" /LENGTH=84 /DNA_ID=CAMNT_0042067843 /DNA_START=108 /DNA_END=359 /DNA_ORIENTATION=-
MGSCLGKCFGKGGPEAEGYQSGGGGSGSGPDREEVRQNALAAAERRANEQAKRGVQGNKPTLTPPKPAASGGRNEVNFSDAKTW